MRKDRCHAQHRPSHGRCRVKPFGNADKGHVLPFEKVEEIVDVTDVTREAVKPVDDDYVDLPISHSLKQILKAGPIRILAAGDIFAEKSTAPPLHLGVVTAALLLIVQRIVVVGALLLG